MAGISPKIDRQLQEIISGFYADPLGYVMFNFPWDTDPSIQMVELPKKYRDRYNSRYGPGAWCCDLMEEWSQEIKLRAFDGRNAVEPIRFSTVSGHGIGKTTTTAFVIKFIHDTRPFSRQTVTAVTDAQLRSKTWAELAKWHNASLTKHWSELTSGRGAMALRNKAYPETWYAVAQTSREENSESFAGQHASNSSSVYIFDEASGIPEKIYEVREGGLTDGEPMIFDFGNPTRNSGAFFENMMGKSAHKYKKRFIDARTVEITNKQFLDEFVKEWGEDHDRTRVRVKGQFPRQSSAQFIGGDIVSGAMLRPVVQDRTAALIIGVDVARFGDDDSVIYPRLGMDARSFMPKRFSGLDNVQLAQQVMAMIRDFERLGQRCAGLFVDEGGVGGGVVDILRHAGFRPIGVNFGSAPMDPMTYRYRVDEMWGRMREALKDRLCLPDIEAMKLTGESGMRLNEQLTNREYGVTSKDQINLERKDEMKKRGIGSPDMADALALTFAQDVAPAGFGALNIDPTRSQVVSEYDPLAGAF